MVKMTKVWSGGLVPSPSVAGRRHSRADLPGSLFWLCLKNAACGVVAVHLRPILMGLCFLTCYRVNEDMVPTCHGVWNTG